MSDVENLSPLPESLGTVGGGCLVCFLFEVEFAIFLGATEKEEWASEEAMGCRHGWSLQLCVVVALGGT